MKFLRLRQRDQDKFAEVPEIVMDCHLARSESDEFYLVIGNRVSILLDETTLAEPEPELFDQLWLRPSISSQERTTIFQRWLSNLNEAPALTAATPVQAWASFWGAYSPVAPHHPSSSPAPASAFHIRPPSVCDHDLPRDSHLPLGSLSDE